MLLLKYVDFTLYIIHTFSATITPIPSLSMLHTSRLVFVLGCLAPSLCQDATDSTATYAYTYGDTATATGTTDYDYGTYGTTADG